MPCLGRHPPRLRCGALQPLNRRTTPKLSGFQTCAAPLSTRSIRTIAKGRFCDTAYRKDGEDCTGPELYHWFDASSLLVEPVNLDVLNDTPLPYQTCAIVGRRRHEWLVILRQEENTVAAIGWTMGPTGYRKHPAFTYTRGPDGLKLHALDEAHVRQIETPCAACLLWYGAWLNTLDTGSVAHVPTARKSHQQQAPSQGTRTNPCSTGIP